jgi:hypothetical protein
VAVVEPPAELVAVQVTIVRPSGNFAGRSFVNVTVPHALFTAGVGSVTLVHEEIVSSGSANVNVGASPVSGAETVSVLFPVFASTDAACTEPVSTRFAPVANEQLATLPARSTSTDCPDGNVSNVTQAEVAAAVQFTPADAVQETNAPGAPRRKLALTFFASSGPEFAILRW